MDRLTLPTPASREIQLCRQAGRILVRQGGVVVRDSEGSQGWPPAAAQLARLGKMEFR